ncbi:MAG: DUF456 domain-containing protein [Anaerolineae bacterium]
MVLPVWVFWLAIALFILGLVGVVMPALPGVGLIWIVILIYAVAERFATIDPLSFAVLTLLGIAGVTADVWLQQLGAKVAGASFRSTVWGLAGALLGGLIGLIFGGVGALPGMWVGTLLGVLLGEYLERGSLKAALKAMAGVAVGSAISTAVQLAIALAMISIFVWQVLRG